MNWSCSTNRRSGINLKSTGAAPFLYYTYREDGRLFQDVAMWTDDTDERHRCRANPRRSVRSFVTDGILPMLGAQPALGRLISKHDDSPAADDTMMLSGGYWRTRFGSDPSVIGRRIMVDGKPREVIGVLPDSFRFLDQKPSLILPLRLDRGKVHLGHFSYSGSGADEAWRDAGAGECRPCPHDPDRPSASFRRSRVSTLKMFEEAQARSRARGCSRPT